MKKPRDVDSYITQAPKEVRDTLIELRRVIKKAAPKASERISYGMPHYEYGGSGYKGRLISFAAFKKHISIFISPSYERVWPKELKKYHFTTATFHFPMNKPLPLALIGKTIKALVKERDKENKAKQ